MHWRIDKFNRDIDMYTPVGRFSAWGGVLLSAVLFGASFDDYIRYRFWEKSLSERNQFITYIRSKRIIKKYNMNGEWQVFHDKSTFNSFFRRFVNRNWLLLKNATEEDVKVFLKKHNHVILKPVNGGQGGGVKLIDSRDINPKDLIMNFRMYMLEEVIRQHKDMEALNPSSCNTIRVYTFIKDDVVTILCAALKTGGTNSCVDNLHSGGVCGVVDIDTGVVVTKGLNYQYQYNVYHPVTGKQIVGFHVPNWESVVATAIGCAKTIPSVGYVGWDIAITENGCEVIEGNHDPGHDLMQMVDQKGKYKMIKRICEKA